MTEPIIKWLNKQRQTSAGWGSTVDTLLSVEALLKWSKKYGPDFQKIHGGIAIEVDTVQGRRSIIVNDLNDVITVDASTKDINVEAKGRGLALVHLASSFATTSQSAISQNIKVSAFDLEPRVELRQSKHGSMELILLSCQR